MFAIIAFKKFVVPLRLLYDQKAIRNLISVFKEAHGDDRFELDDVLSFAKEYFKQKLED